MDMTKLIVAFRNFANMSNNGCDNKNLCFPEISMVPLKLYYWHVAPHLIVELLMNNPSSFRRGNRLLIRDTYQALPQFYANSLTL